MPLSPSEYQDRLDVLTKEIRDIDLAHSQAAADHRELKAEYELVEARVMKDPEYATWKLGEKEKIARVVAEDDHNELWTRYNEAKGEVERLDKSFANKDLVRSNIQSNLKVSK